jgi:serine protease AprX
VNVRVLDANGGGTVSTVLSGIQWVIQNRSKDNIKVLNLSLGHPVGESYTTDPICQAVEAAWRAGIVVVCAAGNSGRMDAVEDQPDNEGWGTAYGSIQCPGNDPYVITVGATKSMDGKRADDKIATYSSRGPSRLDLICKPDLVAPGNKVVSLDVNNSTLDLVHL